MAKRVIHYLIATPQAVAEIASSMGGFRALLGSEADRAQQLTVPADVQAFLASRTALRLLIAHQLGADPRDDAAVALHRSCPDCGGADHGKPLHAKLSVSSSRTRSMVMAAVGPHGVSLGADIEYGPALSPPGVFPRFDATALHPVEQKLIPGNVRADQLRLSAFSAKESLLKTTGVGLRADLRDIQVFSTPDQLDLALNAPADPYLASWLPRALNPPLPRRLYCRWIYAGAEHVATLAAARALPVAALQLKELRLRS